MGLAVTRRAHQARYGSIRTRLTESVAMDFLIGAAPTMRGTPLACA